MPFHVSDEEFAFLKGNEHRKGATKDEAEGVAGDASPNTEQAPEPKATGAQSRTLELTRDNFYEVCCQLVAEARDVEALLGTRSAADKFLKLARIANNRQLEIDAAEVHIRSVRRLGEMMKEQPKAKGGRPYQATGSASVPVERLPTFKEAGIDKHLAAEARWSADQSDFEARLGEWRKAATTGTDRVTTTLKKETEKAEKEQVKAEAKAAAEAEDIVERDDPDALLRRARRLTKRYLSVLEENPAYLYAERLEDIAGQDQTVRKLAARFRKLGAETADILARDKKEAAHHGGALQRFVVEAEEALRSQEAA